ncbi:MAG: site-2 protease family protein, partial [Aquihabitans sp.]
ELGHFIMAKRAGMKATEFFLGFGPKIWSTQRGETEYGIKAIPAGAYVRIIGMHNLEEVPAADEGRTYRQKNFGQRIGVAVAGSTMHFLLALVLIFAALVGVGQPAGTLDPNVQAQAWRVDSIVEGSGAEAAGLREGDRLISIDGQSVADWTDLRKVSAPLKGQTVDLVYERAGKKVTTPLTLKPFYSWIVDRVLPKSGIAAAGIEVGDQIMAIDGQPTSGSRNLEGQLNKLEGTTVPIVVERDRVSKTTPVNIDSLRLVGNEGFIGIGRGDAPSDRIGPLQGLVQAPKDFLSISWQSVTALGKIFSPSGISDFAGQVTSARDDRSEVEAEQAAAAAPVSGSSSKLVTGSGSGARPTGENRLLSIYGLVHIGSDVGQVDPGALIVLFAMINIFLGVFNLLPTLPFDGGHVAIAVYEKVQERRLHRKRYFADISRLLPVTWAVVILMAMIFFSSTYLDIANPMVTR